MKLADFEHEHNQFVALEYYAFIWNRTLLVLLTDAFLIGVVAAGLLAARPGTARALGASVEDPKWYIDKSYLRNVQTVDLLGEHFLQQNRGNFRMPYGEIAAVRYDAKRKWGMGGFPHNGRVYVSTRRRTRELIVLGDQSGATIARRISEKVVAAA